MKLLIELSKEVKDYPDLFGLKEVLGKDIFLETVQIAEKKNKRFMISVKPQNLFDDVELYVYKTLSSLEGLTILEIDTLSRSFIDIHSFGSGELKGKFRETLNRLKTKNTISPLKITEKSDGIWVGLYKYTPSKNFNPMKALSDIYRVGMGLGLAPKDMMDNLHNTKLSEMSFLKYPVEQVDGATRCISQ